GLVEVPPRYAPPALGSEGHRYAVRVVGRRRNLERLLRECRRGGEVAETAQARGDVITDADGGESGHLEKLSNQVATQRRNALPAHFDGSPIVPLVEVCQAQSGTREDGQETIAERRGDRQRAAAIVHRGFELPHPPEMDGDVRVDARQPMF